MHREHPEEAPTRRRRLRPFIVEADTTAGRICERFATLEQAQARVAQISDAVLRGLPLIFEELPDGSYRVVRDDGKPLQWHRLMDEAVEEAPLPLTEIEPSGKPFVVEIRPARPAGCEGAERTE